MERNLVKNSFSIKFMWFFEEKNVHFVTHMHIFFIPEYNIERFEDFPLKPDKSTSFNIWIVRPVQ